MINCYKDKNEIKVSVYKNDSISENIKNGKKQIKKQDKNNKDL